MSQYLGDISAYALAVSQGYTGTEEEYAELMASYATVGQTAVTAAQTATTKASEAATSATTATNKASEATTAATTATTKAGEASTSASTATSAKDTAVSASQTATTKATEATTAAATAVSAKDDAVSANTAAQSAKTAAQTAQTGAETAAASVQESAEQIATNASDISQLKSEITDKSDTADMLKAFPTDTASGSVASFADGANVPVKSLIVNIDPVQSGSGDPSPDNVRPISGWSEVNVNACGVNIWDGTYEAGKWIQDTSTGAVATLGAGYNLTGYIPVVPGLTYYGRATGSSRATWFDANKNAINQCTHNQDATFTVPANARYVRFTITDAYLDDFYINYPSTDTDYHPYDGQSINISLGQIVYGGKLDVTNGVLTVDRAGVDLGTLTWTMTTDYSVNRFNATISDMYKLNTSPYTDIMCSAYKPSDAPIYTPNTANCEIAHYGKTIYISDSNYNSASAFKTAMNGVQLLYPLAEPITIQLDPHEVTALLGSNNIWADSGDSEVEYRADPTLYIQRLTEPDADMVADANIVSGQYFMVGNTLYKATANIASGATISPNVNCTRKSLSEALNELNA